MRDDKAVPDSTNMAQLGNILVVASAITNAFLLVAIAYLCIVGWGG